MAAKIQKLEGQLKSDPPTGGLKQLTDIFNGIAIHVNGYTSEYETFSAFIMFIRQQIYYHVTVWYNTACVTQ